MPHVHVCDCFVAGVVFLLNRESSPSIVVTSGISEGNLKLFEIRNDFF